ncbi:MAG: glycosyltransferase family 39 protein [Candidatus Magnetoovum sp. WYHC-5]|nr:glycosyltransferase family 39 protein [Candidatus Magnetoovum sp. WYHC-5]
MDTLIRDKIANRNLLLILIGLSIFRIFYIKYGPLDLSPDEAHYWEWSRRLDISYYSKGPLVAYFIYVGRLLLGETVLAVRIMAVIFSALSSIYLYKLYTVMYKDVNKALLVAVIFQIVPLFSTYSVVFTIDTLFVFFWVASLYYLWLAIGTVDKYRNWTLLGMFIGLGMLAKYTMVFFTGSAFLLLVFKKREILKTFKPYYALLISIILFSPVIIWNYQHNWLTIKHAAGQAHVHDGLKISFTSLLDFLGSQVGVLTPVLAVAMMWALFRLKKIENSLRSDFLIYLSLPTLIFFLLKSVQGKVQANWAMAGYITTLIAFVRYYFSIKSQRLVIAASIGLALFLTIVSHYPAFLKLKPKIDPSSRLRGWSALGSELDTLYDSMKKEAPVLIFSDKYQVSSELAFYMKEHPVTFCINLGRRMNQYDMWPSMNDVVKPLNGQQINGILVRTGSDDLPLELFGVFNVCVKRSFNVYEGEYLLRDYSIFMCRGFNGINLPESNKY